MIKRRKKEDEMNHGFLDAGDTIIDRLKSNSPLNEDKPPGPKTDERTGDYQPRSMIGSPELESEVMRIRHRKAMESKEERRNERRGTRMASGISMERTTSKKLGASSKMSSFSVS